MVLWEKVFYRCSSGCITVNGIMHGINLLPFLTTLRNSPERQERDMNELFYIGAVENKLVKGKHRLRLSLDGRMAQPLAFSVTSSWHTCTMADGDMARASFVLLFHT